MDERIETLLATDQELRQRAAILRSIPGFGPVLTANLIGQMPELGTLHEKQAAALVGLAPINCESGKYKGHRRIKGGPSGLRRLLYQAALSAARFNPILINFASFLRPSGTTRDVLNLGHGASGQATLVSQYSNNLKKYVHKPMQHPVIILCDNDSGPATVFKNATKKSGKTISKATTDAFYHLGKNLYLVKVPEGTASADRDIEDLFQPAVLATTIAGKSFDKKKIHGDETAYGKVIFAEKVVRAKASTVDFSGFTDLLSRIDQCLTHYKTITTAKTPVATNGSGTP